MVARYHLQSKFYRIRHKILCNRQNTVFKIDTSAVIPDIVPRLPLNHRLIATPEELDPYRSDSRLSEDFFKLRSFLKDGARVYLAFCEGRIAGYYCLTELADFAPFLYNRHPLFHGPGHFYIFFCRTMEDFQGNRLYSYMLTAICRDVLHGDVCIFISTGVENHASIKGIRNAGFEEIGEIDYRKIGPFTISSKFYGITRHSGIRSGAPESGSLPQGNTIHSPGSPPQ